MRLSNFLLSTVAALTMATSAFAGEQYVDPTGYAVSGYDVVAYFDLDQVPVGQAQPAAVAGDGLVRVPDHCGAFPWRTRRAPS